MSHCRELLRRWRGGTVILSPRDLEPNQLTSLAQQLTRLPNGRVLLDPQFYLPRSDHERLTSHDYWPGPYHTNAFFGGPGIDQLLGKLIKLNRDLGCHAFVIPGLVSPDVDSTWLDSTRAWADATARLQPGMPTLLTVALSAASTRSNKSVQDVLDELAGVSVDGVYLLVEHPNEEYLVSDPVWLSNQAELVAGLRLQGKSVVVGYANHQQLCLASAGANAVASGTFLNVRKFSPDRFRAPDSEIKRKSTWYYAPAALSEFKLSFLDMADQVGLLGELRAPTHFGSNFCDDLFSGVQPTSVGLKEPMAFRHYLQCLWHQCAESRQPTFQATVDRFRGTIDAAERLLDRLEAAGVPSGRRGFLDQCDVARAAIASLNRTRGPRLKRAWAKM